MFYIVERRKGHGETEDANCFLSDSMGSGIVTGKQIGRAHV